MNGKDNTMVKSTTCRKRGIAASNIHNYERKKAGPSPHYQLSNTRAENYDEQSGMPIPEINKAQCGDDLATGMRQLYTLEKEFLGKTTGTCIDWVGQAYEINEDFELPLSDVINEICTALQEAAHLYGKEVAVKLYNTGAIVLPNEIKVAAHYLSLGGCFDSLTDLARKGFFMEERSHDELIKEINAQIEQYPIEDCACDEEEWEI